MESFLNSNINFRFRNLPKSQNQNSKIKNKYVPLSYNGKIGINSFLVELIKFGWEPIYEEKNIIALKKEGQSITLEPGGQIELSGAPLKSLHST